MSFQAYEAAERGYGLHRDEFAVLRLDGKLLRVAV